MTISIYSVDQYGNFGVATEGDDGIPHARIIESGHFEQSGALWVETDVSGEPAEVQTMAAELWTPENKAAWKAFLHTKLPPPPSTNPADYPLTMRQLRLALLTFGSKPVDFVASVIANIADPTQKAKATIWYEETKDNITWDHPETQLLIAASGLPLDQASALWLKAKDL